jgi:hypothetical protein
MIYPSLFAYRFSSNERESSCRTQVLWSMEVIGHTFSCPIEDDKIIDSALDLYSRWMFGNSRPLPIAHNEDSFLKEMFQHISMLFAPRKTYCALLPATLPLPPSAFVPSLRLASAALSNCTARPCCMCVAFDQPAMS